MPFLHQALLLHVDTFEILIYETYHSLFFRHNVYMISYAKKEHRSPELLALNPRGQVPTLRLKGHIINESLAAIDFIEVR